MSSPTWTPAALSSEARPLAGTCWRMVEAQHLVSTMKLVDTQAEQELLEQVVERVKPPVPPECRALHYLLATPFRYGAYPRGSRFRRAGPTPGVFYAAETPATAAAELAFYRLLFFSESPATPWPADAGAYTAFAVVHATARALDLTAPPLDRDRAHWTDPIDYAACQDLADAARAAAIETLRYASARDPAGGANIALTTCRAFTAREPAAWQSWRIHLGPRGVRALCEFPASRLAFDRAAFAADPRIAGMRWER